MRLAKKIRQLYLRQTMSNNRDKLKERIEEGAIGGGVIGLAIGAPYAGAVLGASGQVIYHAYEVSGVKDTVCGMFRRWYDSKSSEPLW